MEIQSPRIISDNFNFSIILYPTPNTTSAEQLWLAGSPTNSSICSSKRSVVHKIWKRQNYEVTSCLNLPNWGGSKRNYMNHAYLAGILELFRCSAVCIERIIKNTMTTGIVDKWADPKEIDKKLLQSLRLVRWLKSMRGCVHDTAALRMIVTRNVLLHYGVQSLHVKTEIQLNLLKTLTLNSLN